MPLPATILPMQLEFQPRKCLLPGIQQLDRVPAGHGEEQFKVLAVGQRRQRRRLVAVAMFVRTWLTCPRLSLPQFGRARNRQRGLQNFRAHFACLQNMGQIAGQSVAQIQHGMEVEMVRQPARFRQARLEVHCRRGA